MHIFNVHYIGIGFNFDLVFVVMTKEPKMKTMKKVMRTM